MKQKNDTEKRVEQALASLDGIQRAEPQPWLFSRVKARLMKEEKTPWERVSSFLARPAIAIAGLCFILVLNGFLLFNQDRKSSSTLFGNQSEILDSESLTASSSSFDYENLVQHE